MPERSKEIRTYYVSPVGHDRCDGQHPERSPHNSTNGPFRTLERARKAVRRDLVSGCTGDIIVELQQGRYDLGTPLTLTEVDGGSESQQVVYRARDGEKVILTGGRKLRQWQQENRQVFRTSVQTNDARSIYENGRRGHLARFPDESYLRAAGPLEEQSKRGFRFCPGDVPRIQDTDGLEVGIWPGGPEGEWNWFFQTIPVSRIDYDNNLIKVDRASRYVIGPGSRYFLQGHRDFLTVPGEFHIDRQRNELSYRPRCLPVEQQEVVLPSADAVVAFRGKDTEHPVRNISLEGLTLGISHSGGGVVVLENAQDIRISGCEIRNGGGHGVFGRGYVQNVKLEDNKIHDVGHTGILLNGGRPSIICVSKNNRVSNNHIFDCGRVMRHGAGIQLNNSGHNEITHNRIHDVPRYAISLKSARPGVIIGKNIDGVNVTRENAKDFALSRDNLIACNDVSRANLDSQDTGVIEAWGAGTGNVIRDNRIHHSNIHMSFGFGIYLDDACDDFTVTRNILDCLQKDGDGELSAPLLIKGIGNRVTNNLVVNNDATAAMRFIEMANEPNREVHVESNVFCNTGDVVYVFENHDTESQWQKDRLAFADRNLIFNEEGRYRIKGVPSAETLDEWQTVLNGKYDQNSRVADPRLIDAAAEDYRLSHDSPARLLGYQEIDRRPIGLTAEFPFADPEEPLHSIFPSINGHYTGAFEMQPGEEARLEVTARTETGYVADLEEAEASFRSDDESVAMAKEDGLIQARNPGTTTITVCVRRDAERLTTVQEIVVE